MVPPRQRNSPVFYLFIKHVLAGYWPLKIRITWTLTLGTLSNEFQFLQQDEHSITVLFP